MKKSRLRREQVILFLITVTITLLLSVQVYAVDSEEKLDCDCSDTGVPAFLASGLDPNVLLLIDNSASMYDIAYTKADSFCFDDTFDSSKTYSGYFDSDEWYIYLPDATPNESPVYDMFRLATESESEGECSGYGNSDVCVSTSIVDSTAQVDSFKVTGNFLNWATSSKFDVEKKILTGGKYNAATEAAEATLEQAAHLESEGRGCSGNSFIKQVQVTKDDITYYLTLGVRSEGKDSGIYTTLIDILPISTEAVNTNPCQTAADLMIGDGNLGSIKQAIIECLEITNEWDGFTPGIHDKQALINSLHDCWYLNKHEEWPGGDNAQGFNYIKWCEEVYTLKDARSLNQYDSAYICYGDGSDTNLTEGFIGECWNPPAGDCYTPGCNDPARPIEESGRDEVTNEKFIERCSGSGVIERCKNVTANGKACISESDWFEVTYCPNGAGGWKEFPNGDYDSLDECITDARERFCNFIEVPQVIDPSDLTTTTGETWNLPALLMEQGAYSQIGLPMATYKVKLKQETQPTGLLKEYEEDLRIGAMSFNKAGSATECTPLSPYIDYDCNSSDKDGSYLVYPIGQGSGHTTNLVTEINKIKAESWTPLAEGMFNAIGYYTQRSLLRLNDTDFNISSSDEPIQYWCEDNAVLIITDGASTADQNPAMEAFAAGADVKDDDVDPAEGCAGLYGSTYLDDLTYYAKYGENIYEGGTYLMPETAGPMRNIDTFIVIAGTPDDVGTGECNPKTLLDQSAFNGGTNEAIEAPTVDALAAAIEAAFQAISSRSSAGSAASVIASTRSGEGAVYQAIFWPELDLWPIADKTNDAAYSEPTSWVGEVHAVLVDELGNLYEDTNLDDQLTYSGDDITDKKVLFYYDPDKKETRGCYGELISEGVCDGTDVSIHDVKYLWSAAEWLSAIEDTDITINRSDISDKNDGNYISDVKKRLIFTWNDLNNDGDIDQDTEILAFDNTTDWSILTHNESTRAPLWWDFNLSDSDGTTLPDADMVAGADIPSNADEEVDALVDWLRGKDAPWPLPEGVEEQDVYRRRKSYKPANFNSISNTSITWRLGSVIHSTPTVVGKPKESYHMLYRDASYADFLTQYLNRRNVIYFGGNDGMLHAVNGGFFDDKNLSFSKKLFSTDEASAPELGAELWAYVPYNLLPHLHCLSNKEYSHHYYMDQKPRIFDVKIFDTDDDHPGGWGTILVAGMRFGGKTVESDFLDDLEDPVNPKVDNRKFVSSYVIFDITNPEVPPTLLGEMTYSQGDAVMGYTTPIPTVVPMKEGNIMKWYLVLGSGPTEPDGVSTQPARVAVFPLDQLIDGKPFRIPSDAPSVSTNAGSYKLTTSPDGFVSDLITVDFDLVNDYRADCVYFGTVEGDWYDDDNLSGGWTGKFYRWATLADEGTEENNGNKTPDEWSKPAVMFNPGRPITAAPSIGYDGENYWVYFGTGRFLHKNDTNDTSSNAQDYFFGLKEPMDCDGNFLWASNKIVAGYWQKDADAGFIHSDLITTSSDNYGDGDTLPGNRHLLQVDQIEVAKLGDVEVEVEGEDGTTTTETITAAPLSCKQGDCLPLIPTTDCFFTGLTVGDKLTYFDQLIDYIVGGCCIVDADGTDKYTYVGTDGWKYAFPIGEKNVGQATLLGGLTTFTTYKPSKDDPCVPEGQSYLYALYYQTGTSWHESVFNEDVGLTTPTGEEETAKVVNRLSIGQGLATTPNLHVGTGDGAKAFVQTTTGAIIEIKEPELPIDNTTSRRTSWQCN